MSRAGVVGDLHGLIRLLAEELARQIRDDAAAQLQVEPEAGK